MHCIAFLSVGYAKNMWWFELVDMGHKLMLTSILAFFPSAYQMPVGMMTAILYAIVILLRKPYFRKGDDRLAASPLYRHHFVRPLLWIGRLFICLFVLSSFSFLPFFLPSFLPCLLRHSPPCAVADSTF